MRHQDERSLVQRLQGKPFALLGVNCDEERDVAQEVIRRERLTWPSWSDPGGQGPICKSWRPGHWPGALFVLDHRGMIRYRNLPVPLLGEAVERLLGELEEEKLEDRGSRIED